MGAHMRCWVCDVAENGLPGNVVGRPEEDVPSCPTHREVYQAFIFREDGQVKMRTYTIHRGSDVPVEGCRECAQYGFSGRYPYHFHAEEAIPIRSADPKVWNP